VLKDPTGHGPYFAKYMMVMKTDSCSMQKVLKKLSIMNAVLGMYFAKELLLNLPPQFLTVNNDLPYKKKGTFPTEKFLETEQNATGIYVILLTYSYSLYFYMSLEKSSPILTINNL
jgi:hypothetical protein